MRELHGNADNLIALLVKQDSGGRGIDPARHGDKNTAFHS
jgi:hypothetical protein